MELALVIIGGVTACALYVAAVVSWAFRATDVDCGSGEE